MFHKKNAYPLLCKKLYWKFNSEKYNMIDRRKEDYWEVPSISISEIQEEVNISELDNYEALSV